MDVEQTDPASLIDQALINSSADRWDLLKHKLSAAQATLASAEAAVTAADLQFKAAVAGAAEGDAQGMSPAQANAAYQAAVGDRDLAQRAADYLESAAGEAFEQYKAAARDAYAPVLQAGAQIRIAAAALADQARQVMTQAEAETRRGTAFCQVAFQAGLRPFDGGRLSGPVRTEAEERAIWNGVVS